VIAKSFRGVSLSVAGAESESWHALYYPEEPLAAEKKKIVSKPNARDPD